ncbi:hypothetical protein J4E82_006515 [Alternaria postmessia]|uniref:uncharacterized protein n=1 Tax=Alternaria postmessia TaxID=1187938 RepID=UPI00222437CC|nr:uncharacterized protein J4E82_006515 [Alternaria postmessia]KAI5374837.1 hypothetical protein J4E82_006515 [Alternaria postmessia]
MTRRGGGKPPYHCAICEQSFTIKADLRQHTANHSDTSNKKLICATCGWNFDDSHALELHRIQSSHGDPQTARPNPRNEDLEPLTEESEMAVTCSRCQKTFNNQKQHNAHRSNVASDCADWRHTAPKHSTTSPEAARGYVDLDRPKDGSPVVPFCKDPNASSSSEADTVDSDDGVKCHDCKRVFHSRGHYNNHMLGCTPISSSKKHRQVLKATKPGSNTRTITNHVRASPQQRQAPTAAPAPRAQSSSSTLSAPINDLSSFACNFEGCGRVFRSEAGLNQHKTDAHGIGGQALNAVGRAVREQMRQEGLLLQPSSASSRGRGQRGRPAPRASPSAPRGAPSASRMAPPAPQMTPSKHRTTQQVPSQPLTFARPMPIQHHMPPTQPIQLPSSTIMSGVAELDQAKQVQAKILRLLIQSDIFIQHDGKMNVCGIDWTRVGVAKQHEVVAMFDTMCHLPKILQGEYVPAPKAFKDDYNTEYPFSDFEPSPARNPSKPALDVVAISCSKVVLKGGFQEIVKIAAVDLATCRILMNHLVCTDPHAEVLDWRSAVTGLFSWRDMEAARKSGYKVFKGWMAARNALHKFIDKETIVVGHNLRSDLDSLRMVHGRAVDIAKVVEKAAQGPLSKAQLALDSLCKTYSEISLRSDPEYGRDSLMNAFAVREFGLWALKNREQLARIAKQKSLDYQATMPRAAVVGA